MTQYNDDVTTTGTTTDSTIPPATGTTGATTRRTHGRDHDGGDLDVAESRYVPTDRVRWASILGGVFAAISTLALLGTLGAAIGLSSYDAGDSSSSFGIGAGIWGIISALLAFFVGGFVASNAGALPGRATGVLNGLLVWAVAIPLTAYLAASLAGSVASTLGSVAGTAATAASNVAGGAAAGAGAAASNPENVDQAQQAAPDVSAVQTQAQQAATDLQNRASNVTGDDIARGAETVADKSAGSVWGTLIGMVLSLAAAGVGGLVGARGDDDLRNFRDGRIGA